ncbi:MAG: hypothetical protein A3G87_08350 [Omnitrophica bacterium RIFCSPLOWO2_12_FULL_50_11]|nr:MAG: hypothetical protein A3G87_08350 [Omnitrophica bacterium RIFCSPLOWO2_12_FULL_50_11]
MKKTGRLVVADTSWKTCGVSAEIAALVAEKAFEYLKAPIQRVTLPEASAPTSVTLEKAFYPGPLDIISAVKRTMEKEAKRLVPVFESNLAGRVSYEKEFTGLFHEKEFLGPF